MEVGKLGAPLKNSNDAFNEIPAKGSCGDRGQSFGAKSLWSGSTLSDKAEAEIIYLADSQLDMPIGVAFIDATGEPGWIGANPDLQIHHGSLRGCWPTIHPVDDL